MTLREFENLLSLSARRRLVKGFAALALGLILLTSCSTPSGFEQTPDAIEAGPKPASTIRDVDSSLVYLKLNFSKPLVDGRTFNTCSGVFTGEGEITTIGHCVIDEENNAIASLSSVDYLFLNDNHQSGSNPMNMSVDNRIVTLFSNDTINQQSSFIPISNEAPKIGEELYVVTTNPEANTFDKGSESFSKATMWSFTFTGGIVNSYTGDCISETCYFSELGQENVMHFGHSGSPIIRYNEKKKLFEVVGFASATVSSDRYILVYILIARR